MKLPLFFATILLSIISILSNIYNIQIQTIDGKQLNLEIYKGKKIIITAFDAAAPDLQQLAFLDSLQLSDRGSVIIAVPALDFSISSKLINIIKLRDSLNLHFVITSPGLVKKKEKQLQLFKFLTSVDENGHFDIDVEQPDQLYFINTNGMLYSILKKETPHNIVNEIRLQQTK